MSSCSARVAPWCTSTRRSGTNFRASAAQLPTTAGGAIDQRGTVVARAAQVREHRGGLAQAHVQRQAAAEAGTVEELQPHQGVGLVASAARRGSPPASSVSSSGTLRALRSRSAAQPSPATSTPPESGEPSRPSAWRSISAPVRRVRSARAPRGPAAAAWRSAWSSSTQRPWALTSGRASRGEPADVLGGELDVVEDRRPAHRGELLRADHRLLRLGRGQAQRSAVALRR